MFFNYEADQAADPHHPNRQYFEILKIELLDAGFDILSIERAMTKCPPMVVEIAAKFAASCAFKKRSAAEMFSNLEFFTDLNEATSEHECSVVRNLGEALQLFHSELRGSQHV
jgi:hypothetical protein